jgi:hypothetical protein
MIQEVSVQLVETIDLEWLLIDHVITRLKTLHPQSAEIQWRYVTRHEASWLVGNSAYKNPNTTFFYAWTGVDQIAEVSGEL